LFNSFLTTMKLINIVFGNTACYNYARILI
jgi:hypothetical protein